MIFIRGRRFSGARKVQAHEEMLAVERMTSAQSSKSFPSRFKETRHIKGSSTDKFGPGTISLVRPLKASSKSSSLGKLLDSKLA